LFNAKKPPNPKNYCKSGQKEYEENLQGLLPKATFVVYLRDFPNPVFVRCKKTSKPTKTIAKVDKKNMKKIYKVFQKPLLWTI
jgi:hypothetical protein